MCGKPTQYNLQTCEYNWRSLPDTHFTFEAQNRRRRHIGILPGLQGTEKYEARKIPPMESPRADPSPPVWDARPPALPLQPLSQPTLNILPWSHEGLRQMIMANNMEAQHSYLRGV